MKGNLLTGLMLALVLSAAAFAQSGDSSSAQGTTPAGAAGAQEPAAAQGTPASAPAQAGSAQLAAEKASSPEVKSFAQKMADDHKQANDTLKQIATSLQYEPPSRPSSHAKSERAQLEKLSGADFDREFLNLVVKEHQKDVAVFERESRRAAAPSGLKSFAGTTLTGLQDHIKMAQDLSSKLGAGSPSRPSSSQR